jgi:hypothetical protein
LSSQSVQNHLIINIFNECYLALTRVIDFIRSVFLFLFLLCVVRVVSPLDMLLLFLLNMCVLFSFFLSFLFFSFLFFFF